MRNLLIILFLLTGAGARAATHTIQMLSNPNSFSPNQLTIDVGDTVVWTNATGVFHDTVHRGTPRVWQSSLFRFSSFQFVFNVPAGNYDYFCTPHQPAMSGRITVRPANTAPTVTITSPANGAAFSSTETFEVTVTATDNVAVARVELLVDGIVTQTRATTPYNFSLQLPVGTHTLRAQAFDVPGLRGESAVVNVTVAQGNLPPTVEFESVTNGMTFPSNQPITIVANATDDDAVDRVEFFVDGLLAGVDTTFPYSFTASLAPGSHVITATVFDAQGLPSNPTTVTIGVDAPPPAPPEVQIFAPMPFQNVEFPFSLLTDSGRPMPLVQLAALATDSDGSVTNVEIITDFAAPVGLSTLASNIFGIQVPLAEGTHVAIAIAHDDSGLSSTSAPVVFNVVMTPFSSAVAMTPNATNMVRVGFFGSSGFYYVFESSSDTVTWNPFLTNVMYRRILFVDVPTTNTSQIFRARPLGSGALSPRPPGGALPPIPRL